MCRATKSLFAVLSLISVSVLVEGCWSARESFLSIQMCVVDHAGVERLKDAMRAVAKSENLEFIDNSATQGRDLKAVGADKLLKRDAALAIDLHIEGEGGMGVTASNLGLPPFQVALGFTEGSDATKANRLSSRLVAAISQRWHVEKIARGTGALPVATCMADDPRALPASRGNAMAPQTSAPVFRSALPARIGRLAVGRLI